MKGGFFVEFLISTNCCYLGREVTIQRRRVQSVARDTDSHVLSYQSTTGRSMGNVFLSF